MSWIKKIIESEKEDLRTLKAMLKGEKVKCKIDFTDFNPLKTIADNWLIFLVFIMFFVGGFFVGSLYYQKECQMELDLIITDIMGDLNPYGINAISDDVLNPFNFTIDNNTLIK